MIHNGIEHAHLSILCEVRALLAYQFGLSNDKISDYFERWYKEGPLRGNYLIGIGYKGLRFKEGDGIEDQRGIVEGYEDKVTQDVDLSEGTGTWSTMVSRLLCMSFPVDNAGSRYTACRCACYCSFASVAHHLL